MQKIDPALIVVPANSDGKVLTVVGNALTYAPPSSGSGGATYTAGNGIAITGSTIAIDAAKVARKDVAQTIAGDQSFTGNIVTNYLRSYGSSESALYISGGYLVLQSEYGTQFGNGNAQVDFYDNVFFNSEVYYAGEALSDKFAARYPTYIEQTSSFTLARYMSGWTVRLTSSSASTITIPSNATDNMEIGSHFTFQRGAAGTVTFAAQSGVTLELAGGVRTITEQYGLTDVVKTGTDTWSIIARAPFVSPAFGGAPTATTAVSSDNSDRIATTAFVKAALATAFVPREITYEMFHPNHGGLAQFYHAPVAESVRVSPLYGAVGYSVTSAFGTGAPSWGTVTYLNAGSQATVAIPAGGTMRLEFSGDGQGIPRWCHVKRLSGGS